MAKLGRKPYVDRSYMEDEYIKKWLVGLAKNTKRNYSVGIKEWLDFIEMTPSEQIKQRLKDLISEDLTQRTFFENKWREYRELLEQKGDLTDASIRAKLKTVCSFFSRNSLPLRLKRGDWNLTTTQKVVKQKWVPTNKEIRQLYSHANLRDRALLLCLYQSGFSEIDVANMRIEPLTGIYDSPEGEHHVIEKPREKTGNIQATCLSFECIHDLKAMLQERENPTEGFLFVSTTKEKGSPLTVRAIHEAMRGLVERAFGEEKAQEFKTKSLRSAYNSALLRANIQPQELKDLLMGHKRLGARGNYAYDKITISEAYSNAFQFLTINGIQNRKDIEDLRKAQFTQSKLITQLGEENQEQKHEIIELKEMLENEKEERATDYQNLLKNFAKMLKKVNPELEVEYEEFDTEENKKEET